MAEYEPEDIDFEFDDPADIDLAKGEPDGSGGTGRGRRIALMGAVAVIAVALGAYLWYGRATPEPAEPTEALVEPPASEPSPPPEPAPPAAVEVEEPVELPALAASDELVRQLVGAISSQPTLAALLATDNLIRTFVVVVENVAAGLSPATHLAVLKPEQDFSVSGDFSRLVIDARSYERYNAVAQTVFSLDTEGSAELYRSLEPLIDEAYWELGNPESDFDIVLAKAIEEILATPALEGEIPVRTESVTYQFVDPALEELSDAQRQALRMGPQNLRLVQTKLRQLSRALGLETPAAP